VKVLKKKPVAASSKPKTTKTAKLKKEKAIEKPFQSLNISDIVALSDTRVKKIIKDLEIETVSAAMKGADKKVREKVEKNLGVRALKTYKELLKGIKTLSESEIRKSRKLFENQFKKHTK
jgi:flagellar motor switch protein FliG